MKIVKVALWLVLLLVVVAALLIYIAFRNINDVVKTAVETIGPQVTQTRVVLDSANIALMQGRGQLNSLTIGNPAGFTSDHAIQLGEVVLHVDPASLLQDVIVIKEVKIDGANLIAEQKGLVKSNLQALLDNVRSAQPAGSADPSASQEKSTPPAEETDSEGAKAQDVRLMIEKLSFTGASVLAVTEKWGDHSLDLPDINLQNIGDRKTGLTPSELAQAILGPLLDQAKRVSSDKLRKELESRAKEKLKAAEEKLKNSAKEKLEKTKEELKTKEDDLKQKLKEKLGDKHKDKIDSLKDMLGR